ncbi:hypothetical protein Efla_002748 [Eimeria flavescens]
MAFKRKDPGGSRLVRVLLLLLLVTFPSQPSLRLGFCEDEGRSAESLPVFSLPVRIGFQGLLGSRSPQALRSLSRAARAFEAKYRGRVAARFGEALKRFEALQSEATEAVSFAALAADKNLRDIKRQIARAKVENYILTMVTPHLLFFELEVSSMPAEWLSVHLNASEFVKRRKAYVAMLLRQKRHLLSLELEAALESRKPYDASFAATTVLKRELGIARFASPFHTQQKQQQKQKHKQQQRQEEEEKGDEKEGAVWRETETAEAAKDKASEEAEEKKEQQTVSLAVAQEATQHREADVRARALEAISNGVRTLRLDVLACISLNTVTGIWGVDSRQRGYPSLRSKRNLSFGLPDAAVSALIAAVRLEGPSLAARFYHLKRQILADTQGLKAFSFADRLAPVSLVSSSSSYTWSSAVSMVKAGFASYLPFCLSPFSSLLEDKRIDVVPSSYKRAGSFTRPATPETGPFVFLSFTGTARDVKALAREATHACLLALRAPLGPLAWVPPQALAETAARIGERMINEQLRAAARTGLEMLDQLMHELDNSMNSILRQISFDRFEELVHEARQEGLLFPEQLDQLWLQATKEMFGQGHTVFDSWGPIDATWATVPHFHSLPFGVFLFALAPLTAELIAMRIETEPVKAQQKLFSILAAGSEPGALLAAAETGDSQQPAAAAAAAFAPAAAAAATQPAVSSEEQKVRLRGEEDLRFEAEEEEEAEEEFLVGDDPEESTPDSHLDKLENEPLLFSQICDALSLNPQDVQLWATALKRHLGDPLSQAEGLFRSLRRPTRWETSLDKVKRQQQPQTAK